jgi:oligopeptide/dipeptide ABC transporter ATP-binding protein
MSANGSAILNVDEAVVKFWVDRERTITAVNGVSLHIAAGETLGLVGESGCGKSTLGRAILRLVELYSGSVSFLGKGIGSLGRSDLRRLRRDLAVVFQDPRGSLDPRMRVGDIVAEPLRVHRLASGAELDRRVSSLLEQVGLGAEYAKRRPTELSGGQQQRVGIARALVTKPRLVILDEPVSALDVSVQAQVINLLQGLQRELGAAFLFIAHNLAVVRHLSDRVAVMYLGEIVEEGSSHGLFARPRHPYTRGLVASVLRPDLEAPARLEEVARLTPGEVPSMLDPPTGCKYHTRCLYVQDICRIERPLLEEVATTSGHRVACHFWKSIPDPIPIARAR